jgi:hypothetical protein
MILIVLFIDIASLLKTGQRGTALGKELRPVNKEPGKPPEKQTAPVLSLIISDFRSGVEMT